MQTCGPHGGPIGGAVESTTLSAASDATDPGGRRSRGLAFAAIGALVVGGGSPRP